MPSRRRNSKNLSEKIIEDWHITEEGKDIPIQSIIKEVNDSKKIDSLKVGFAYDTKKIHKNDIISSLVALDAIKKVEEEK